MTALRILVLTNLFPTENGPNRGIFVKEQIDSIREQHPDLTIDVRVIEGDRPKGEYLREMMRLADVPVSITSVASISRGGYILSAVLLTFTIADQNERSASHSSIVCAGRSV